MSIFDWLAMGGVLVVAIGAGMIYLPAGVIVAGLGMCAVGVIGAMAVAKRSTAEGAKVTKGNKEGGGP